MVINNQKEVIRFKLKRFIFTAVVSVALMLVVLDVFDNWLSLDVKYTFVTLLITVLVTSLAYHVVLEPCFVSISYIQHQLEVKYYFLNTFLRKKHRIVVSDKDVVKAKIESGLWGIKKYFILFVNTPKGISKYPPISISILGKENYRQLKFMFKLDG